jgi:hypothetical protein
MHSKALVEDLEPILRDAAVQATYLRLVERQLRLEFRCQVRHKCLLDVLADLLLRVDAERAVDQEVHLRR